MTAGRLIASLGLDHFGAFGGGIQRVSFIRIAGLVALISGVILLRSGR